MDFEEIQKRVNYHKPTEDATGLRRWTPGKISPKAARMYRERLAAYKAQQSA